MSTKMDGITQPSLFSGTLRMDIVVHEKDRYRVLSEELGWLGLAEVANRYRSKVVDIEDGRPLNLRLHLGALIAQGMNGWTDRETEEMICYHAGLRLLCGLEQSSETIDHTNIEGFRNQLGAEGVEALNTIVLKTALGNKFTKVTLCSSDTTVQEAPIAYPTEAGHLKRISEKLFGIGTHLKQGMKSKLSELSKRAQKTFAQIRLFTRGKTDKVIERKKRLMKRLHSIVRKMYFTVESEVATLRPRSRKKYNESLELYRQMLLQIWQWIRTGFHPRGKIISLWNTEARAISRSKAGKSTEFGRRWIISRLLGGYILGKPCAVGAGVDTAIVPEVLSHFSTILGDLPKMLVYDRGADSKFNHASLKELGVKKNGIFRKGRLSLKGLSKRSMTIARRERALSEATIATIKSARYGFNRPRARSMQACMLKGQLAILGANLNHLASNFAQRTQ